MNNLKINLHITENCNFRCKYCFAHFEKHKNLSVEEWKRIIDNCCSSGMVNAINFAGGEPLLYSGLTDLVRYARSKNIICSLITNASMMEQAWIRENAELFDTIGISADSFRIEIMERIGRSSPDKEILALDTLTEKLQMLKLYHPSIKLKLNTVVNIWNQSENLAVKIQENSLPIDRWKLLKMSPFDDGRHNNADLAITDHEFFQFVRRNLDVYGLVMKPEDAVLYRTGSGMEIVAERELHAGYIMVDAGGYLVDNTKNSCYTRIINCIDTPLLEGLSELNFIQELYAARYSDE